MSRKRIGRPSKLTPEVKKRLIDAIKAGNYIEPACRFAGIAPATFYRWMERGARASSGEFREFWEELTRAEAEAEARMVAQWQAQIPQDWRAARDFLARRFPERWASKDKIDLEHSGEVMQRHDTSRITEQLAKDRDFLKAIQRAYESREEGDLLSGDA